MRRSTRNPKRTRRSAAVAAGVVTVTAVAGTAAYASVPRAGWWDRHDSPRMHDKSVADATHRPRHSPVPPTSRRTRAARSSATPTPSHSARALRKAAPAYGVNVDKADSAPPRTRRPGSLPRRPAGEVTAVAGKYQNPVKGYIGGKYVMMHRDDNVTLKGRGYVRVRYEIAWFNRPGSMVMPTWTGLQGRLFHVASGGLRRMDDAKPGQSSAYTWMGEPGKGYVVLPKGAQQMWQNEFFYLDGEVTLTNHERGADYNITATPVTWDEVTADITTPRPADPARIGWVRYGLVRDTGDDGAPVPQYVTRQVTGDPARVAQNSKLR
ncbi:hypothetical protein [Spirillospora sp. CA-128828]|uniref:hypothetical protein n=1 Tax=Spirillospora sp. CA-128828 TaxID=3240033 RepID=UPI003D903131